MNRPFRSARCVHVRHAVLGGVVFSIRCDSPEFLEWLRRLFLGEGFAPPEGAVPEVECCCALDCDPPWILAIETPGGLHLARRHRSRDHALEFAEWRDGRIRELGESWLPGHVKTPPGEETTSLLVEYARRRLMRAMVNRTGPDGCRVVHAASLQSGPNGLLLLGGPHTGKSTLALAGTIGGMRCLAEEYSVVDLKTGRLHPFPTPFRMRAGVQGLIPGFQRLARDAVQDTAGDVRWLVDPAQVGADAIGQATRLTHAVCLEPMGAKPVITPRSTVELARSCLEAEVIPGRPDVVDLLWKWTGLMEPVQTAALQPGPPEATLNELRSWMDGRNR